MLAEEVKRAAGSDLRALAEEAGFRCARGKQFHCALHEDRTPSAHLYEGRIYCFSCGKGSDAIDLAQLIIGGSTGDAIRWLAARYGVGEQPARQPEPQIVATYDYTDRKGQLLYQVVRYEPKDFKQRHPDGHGSWVWKKSPQQVLYRLPEVLEAPIVFVVEGEKDVETLRSHGFVATTNAGGANAPWLSQYTNALRGKEVILTADCDAPGRERAKRIGRALLGYVASLLAWQPDGAKDVSEWFANGHSEIELIECVTPQEVAS